LNEDGSINMEAIALKVLEKNRHKTLVLGNPHCLILNPDGTVNMEALKAKRARK
jgi:hypothetical protein